MVLHKSFGATKVLRYLLVVAVFLTATSVFAATQYYVRTEGSDTVCAGTSNCSVANTAPCGGGASQCAFLTITKAVNAAGGQAAPRVAAFSCASGDDVEIGAGTFNEAVSMPTLCRCPSEANRCVINGASSTTTIVNPGTGDAAFTSGSTGSANSHQYQTFSNMNMKGGVAAAFYCGPGKYCQYTRLTNLLIDGLDQIPLNTGAKAGIVFDAAINNTSTPYDNNVIDNVVINGTDTLCQNSRDGTLSRLCGSNTGAIYGNAFGTVVKNSTVRNFIGHFARLVGHGLARDNWVEHVWGGEDDGVLQCYNANDCLAFNNVFFHVNATNGTFGVFKTRATTTEKPSGAWVNNTIIAEPTNCTGAIGGPTCTPDTYLGSDGVTRQGGAFGSIFLRGVLRVQENSGATVGPFPYTYFNRNIVEGFNCANCYGVYSSGGGSPSICPTIFELSGNIYHNTSDPINVDGCATTRYRYDVTETQVDPELNPANGATPLGSLACVPGGLGFRSSWDPNVISKVYAGASLAVAPTGCSNTPPDCGDGAKAGYEDCDGATFGGVSCTSLGFASGSIACTADCKYNTAGCVAGSIAFVRAGSNLAGVQNQVVMGVAPAQNNTLVLCSGRRSSSGTTAITGVTQTGVVWTQVRNTTPSGNDKADMWRGVAGAGASATINVAGGSGSAALTVVEFSGINTTSPIDTDSLGLGLIATADPNTRATGVLSESTDVAIACFSQADNTSATWSAPTNGYTLETGAQKMQGSGGTGATSAITYKILSSTASTETSLHSSEVRSAVTFIATFKKPSLSSASTSFCTNYIKESGEACDLTELDGATCSSLGFTGGTLGCSGTCSYDTTQCVGGSGCTNTIKDGSETDVDCGGGVCPDCIDTKICAVSGDCLSNRCDALRCRSCTDGLTTGAETDTDCGGGICAACATGETCAVNSDCASNLCIATVCTANPTCVDGIKNGAETDVDCGGGTCPGCEITQACTADSDCLLNRCDSLVCRSCFDNVKSGAESDVDCGGEGCVSCANGQTCTTAANCQSNFCSPALVCAPVPVGANCTDSAKNGAETDVDCGGGTCPDCPAGDDCVAASDCISNRCDSLVCRSCTDSLKTGSETDVDCGGGSATGCQACAVTKACTAATDCFSGRCDALRCRSCTDGVKSGTETAIDCGGICPACTSGKACLADSDCLNGTCTNRVCSSQGVVTNPSAPSRTVTVWSVRTDGNDSFCKGSNNRAYDGGGKGSNCAFKTLGKAVAVARCGDTVTVRSGTHRTTTQTATAACSTCPAGLYTYDTMAVVNSKMCAANSVLTIRGERGPENAYLSILDGGGTIEQAIKVQNSRSVVVRDLKIQNFIGTDPNNDAVVGIEEIADSSFVTFTKLRITNLSADGAGAEMLADESQSLLISENYIMSSHPIIIEFLGSNGDFQVKGRVRENTLIRPGYSRAVVESAYVSVNSLRDIVFRGNYLGRTSTLTGSSSINYGMYFINTRDITVQGNTLNDLPVTGGAGYITSIGSSTGCSGGSCNDRMLISNNSLYKSSANAEAVMVFLFTLSGVSGCAGTQVYNNLFSASSGAATDVAMLIACNGNDIAGGQDARANYNMFSNIAIPMSFSGSNWGCPSSACTSHTTKDEHVSTNDVHNTADPGFLLSGFAPYPYFGLKVGATARNAGYNGYCWVAPEDALCDIGAFEMGGGAGAGIPPTKTPLITVPTSAGVN